MQCPKCHKNISDNTAVCPHCHKVLMLECPNCHTLGETSVCPACGYNLLVSCSKCGKVVSTTMSKCKCGFPVKTSVAYKECEIDEFAAISVKFKSLQKIRSLLASKDLFVKFYYKLKNLLEAQLKNIDGKFIIYNDSFVFNMNKELSFPTSAHKAVRIALKIVNAFAGLNENIIQELATPLNLEISIIKKHAEDLLENNFHDSNVKLLTVNKNQKKYLKGTQLIIDQYVYDCIFKEYKTDSLYSVEHDGKSHMYYEVLLENYVLPPSQKKDEEVLNVKPVEIVSNNEENEEDRLKIFDINAKCQFVKTNASQFFKNYQDNKIISIRSEDRLGLLTSDLVKFYSKRDKRVLYVACTEEMNFKPWGAFEALLKVYYSLSLHKDLNGNIAVPKRFTSLVNLINMNSITAASTEDARFAYMEDFIAFFTSLKDCVVIFDGFEYLDDTSIQTLSLFFDKFQKINSQFVFITSDNLAVHSKIKGLLRTSLYTEYFLQKTNIDLILSDVKEEASDFIQSFYFEKIKENYHGSDLYYKIAVKYLMEKGVLINFEDRLLIKNRDSILIPLGIDALLKARLKFISKEMDMSMILAYTTYLGSRLDFSVLSQLGIKDVKTAVSRLENAGFGYTYENAFYVNNFNLIKPVIQASIKKEVNDFLVKNIFATIGKGLDTTLSALLMGKLSLFKEEYLLLWKNSLFAMDVGDYDAYLKNCLGFLSLIEHIVNNIDPAELEQNKKDVYKNILSCLYNYSPEKIYSIEKVLLIDAFNENDDEKIVKLSNLMLQGALIASNYTDALSLLHNILTRMSSPKLVDNGVVNTKFLLLSLVNIEILFNIGDFAQCIETANDLLSVLKPELLETVKPTNFSTNLFVTHLMETFRLAAFANLFMMTDDINEFLNSIKAALGQELPEKDCIIAIKEFFSGKVFIPSDTENASSFSKVIFLILQEFQEHGNDFTVFAQNIYQAKLLAEELNQVQLELFCDLLIAFAYANCDIKGKATSIYNNVLEKADKQALFNISIITKYLNALLYLKEGNLDDALAIINDTLTYFQRQQNPPRVFQILYEKLFIDVVRDNNLNIADLEAEDQKIALLNQDGMLARFI